jgi:hypothetical protein
MGFNGTIDSLRSSAGLGEKAVIHVIFWAPELWKYWEITQGW